MEYTPYNQLLIWKKGIRLAAKTYALTKSFPKGELFGLTSQARRAAASIPANIAEGSKRSTKRDFSQFIHIARGSLAELETHMYLAQQVGIINQEQIGNFMTEATELSKMLRSFHQSLL